MCCRQNNVIAREQIVRQIERAVRANFHFDAFQYAKRAVKFRVQRINFFPLLFGAFRVESARDAESLRMVGDGNVLEAALHCALCHFTNRRAP